MSLRCPFGDQARPRFQAPLFRLDGILGSVRAQILCTRLIDAEPLLRGSEEKAFTLPPSLVRAQGITAS